jgi:hypothetical protein
MLSFKTDKLLFLNISITKYDNEFIFTRRLVMRVLDFTCNDPKCHDLNSSGYLFSNATARMML